MLRFVLLLFPILFMTLGCNRSKPPYEIVKKAISDKGMVVSAHPLASEAGLNILKAGGNAVDAVIATQLALAVVYPRAGNIGGGGFLVYRQNDGTISTLDYREKAPIASERDMYLDDNGDVIPEKSTLGHLAAGVPGTIAGLVASSDQHGRLPWSQLVAPAIALASEGFRLTQTEADRLNNFREAFLKVNEPTIPFIKDSPWKEGDLLVQTDLAQTLTRIQSQGQDGFYNGETADLIIAEMESGGGLITREDLAQYEAVWREPITTDYRGYEIISMPPPSSGGIALAQLFELVEPYPLGDYGFQSKEAIHLMVEAERRVYADRAQHLGDMDYFDVPMEMLMDSAYLAQRMSDFTLEYATESDSIAAGNFTIGLESFQTTHISIVDSSGNAASVTTTLNSNFGCKVFVDGAGFFLNNEMDDFSAKPGVPNQFGLIGAEANAIEPGKRMLSSMTPTIVSKDGDLKIVVGTPGGSTIMTSVFQIIVNVVDFGMSISESVQAPRFHHQWLPDIILVEKGTFSTNLSEELQGMGHEISEVDYIGLVEAISRLQDGTYEGAADRRSDDHASGW